MSPTQIAMTPLVALAVSLAPAPDQGLTHLDLQAKANHKLKDTFHSGGLEGNDLAELPKGKQKFAEISFEIGDGYIQLSSPGGANARPNVPAKVEGIKVNQPFTKLHFLHATGHQAEAGTVIGYYVVHYADKTTAKIEIAYGKDVCNWWYAENEKGPSHAKIGWRGENPPAKERNKKLRLYVTTWENPNPNKRVASIDYVAEENTSCAPFCLAMTVE